MKDFTAVQAVIEKQLTRKKVHMFRTTDLRNQAVAPDLRRNNIPAAVQPQIMLQPGEVPYDMSGLRLQWAEFLGWHSQQAESKKKVDEFKPLLRKIMGSAPNVLVLGTSRLATMRRDGRLNLKDLGKEQPDIVAKYTRVVAEHKFDEAAFRAEMPDMHAAYRGESLRLIG